MMKEFESILSAFFIAAREMNYRTPEIMCICTHFGKFAPKATLFLGALTRAKFLL